MSSKFVLLASEIHRDALQDYQLSLPEIQKCWRYAKRQVKSYQKNALSLQEDWLYERAKAAANDGKSKLESILKCLKHHERTRRLFRKLRAVLNPRERIGLMSLWVPTPSDNGEPIAPKDAEVWSTVTDPKEVESHIISQSKKHFQQAQGTPFTIAPLNNISTAHDNLTAEILKPGLPQEWQNVSPSGWNDETVRFIERLTRDESIPAIDSNIDMEEFKKGIRKWKEKTATSPSGRHLGHLHSLLAPDGVHESDDEESTTPLADKILTMHLDMLNLAIQWGYAPERWRNVVMFVLEKEVGKPKIHRLCNIHLYKADYNFALKLLWSKRLIRHAECYKLINDAQWGRRPKGRATDAVLVKAIQYELTYALRKQLVAMELDARACYDRIIATCAMLISMMHGMPAKACEMQRQMLEEASFKIRTTLGESTDSF